MRIKDFQKISHPETKEISSNLEFINSKNTDYLILYRSKANTESSTSNRFIIRGEIANSITAEVFFTIRIHDLEIS